ncbi:MAG: S-adenosylmethionine:tRNA ribosyltransferase-isomerase, partial [Dehalococcoidia bacterium]
MKTSDFDYHLPPHLIAQTPVEPRDSSRLMVLSRAGGTIEHLRFFELVRYLKAGDVLVFNDSRVIPARLLGRKVGSGGRMELLLLHRVEAGLWQTLVRPGKRAAIGAILELEGQDGLGQKVQGEVVGRAEEGTALIRVSHEARLADLGPIPRPRAGGA